MDVVLTPEWRLAGEVLRQAIEDARSYPGERSLSWQDVQEARLFCTEPAGEWAEARQDWCDAGGFVPEAFRSTAMRTLTGPAA